MSRAGRWAENWGEEGGRDTGEGDAWTRVKARARPLGPGTAIQPSPLVLACGGKDQEAGGFRSLLTPGEIKK